MHVGFCDGILSDGYRQKKADDFFIKKSTPLFPRSTDDSRPLIVLFRSLQTLLPAHGATARTPLQVPMTSPALPPLCLMGGSSSLLPLVSFYPLTCLLQSSEYRSPAHCLALLLPSRSVQALRLRDTVCRRCSYLNRSTFSWLPTALLLRVLSRMKTLHPLHLLSRCLAQHPPRSHSSRA